MSHYLYIIRPPVHYTGPPGLGLILDSLTAYITGDDFIPLSVQKVGDRVRSIACS